MRFNENGKIIVPAEDSKIHTLSIIAGINLLTTGIVVPIVSEIHRSPELYGNETERSLCFCFYAKVCFPA